MSRTDMLIKEAFVLMDQDSDGIISAYEASYALKFVGVPSDASASAHEKTAGYTMPEFKKLAKEKLGTMTPQDSFKKTIDKFDKNGCGELSIDSTTHLVFTMSDILSDEDITTFKKYIDPECKGMIKIEDLTNKVFA